MSNVTLVQSSTTTAPSAYIKDSLYAVHPIMAAYWNHEQPFGVFLQEAEFSCVWARFPNDTRTEEERGSDAVKLGGGVSWVAVVLGILVALYR